jgi:hypothetical protein
VKHDIEDAQQALAVVARLKLNAGRPGSTNGLPMFRHETGTSARSHMRRGPVAADRVAGDNFLLPLSIAATRPAERSTPTLT